MKHSIAKLIFILVLSKIDLLDSRAVEIVYSGHGCDCPKSLPYQVNVPVPRQPDEYEIRSYGYKVDVPDPARAKYSYSFDFVVEEPVPPPQKQVQREVLYAVVDKMVIPKPDCVVDAVSSCAIPQPSPEPKEKSCQYEKTRVCTCGKCITQQDDYVAPSSSRSCSCGRCDPSNPQCTQQDDYVAPSYSRSCSCGRCDPANPQCTQHDDYAAPSSSRSCSCGRCDPANPQCRYVFTNPPSNRITRSGRTRRDAAPKKHKLLKFLEAHVKPLKTTRDAMKSKKSKLVKRDIKGEYDLLQKDHAALDLTIPDIIQYMPETLMPGFKRGKCNIGCKNCLSKHLHDQESSASSHSADSDTAEQSAKGADKNTASAYNRQLLSPRFADASYFKRSVDPYQYQCPCYSALMPPPYVSNPVHLPPYAQNTGYPNWYQPRPLIDPHGHYVFDRLGHKYEVGNEGLKLMTPSGVYEGNVSAPVSTEQAEPAEMPQAAAAEQKPGRSDAPADDGQTEQADTPTLGAPRHLDPTYDPQMEKVIRDIIYKHPDFIEASEHAPGSITLPQPVQSDETMQFLEKLVRGRLNNWFGAQEHAPGSRLHDLNRHSRDAGASIRFIPVVTLDKGQLDNYRQEQSRLSS